MTVAEVIIERVSALSPDRQRRALDFIEALSTLPEAETSMRHDPAGLLSDLAIRLTFGEIEVARKKAWCVFPRELPE